MLIWSLTSSRRRLMIWKLNNEISKANCSISASSNRRQLYTRGRKVREQSSKVVVTTKMMVLWPGLLTEAEVVKDLLWKTRSKPSSRCSSKEETQMMTLIIHHSVLKNHDLSMEANPIVIMATLIKRLTMMIFHLLRVDDRTLIWLNLQGWTQTNNLWKSNKSRIWLLRSFWGENKS